MTTVFDILPGSTEQNDHDTLHLEEWFRRQVIRSFAQVPTELMLGQEAIDRFKRLSKDP